MFLGALETVGRVETALAGGVTGQAVASEGVCVLVDGQAPQPERGKQEEDNQSLHF